MERKVRTRFIILFASLVIGFYFFFFSLSKGLGYGVSFILGVAPFLRTFIKVYYEVQRGEINIPFLKHSSSHGTEQDYKRDEEPNKF